MPLLFIAALWLPLAVALLPAPAQGQDVRRTTPPARIPAEAGALLAVASIRAGVVSADEAVVQLRNFGTGEAAQVARILHAAGHPPAEIEGALIRVLRVPSRQGALLVRQTVSDARPVDGNLARGGGMAVSWCVDRTGDLFNCPANAPITGATVQADIAPGSRNWSGVTLDPANDGPSGGVLVIRPPAAATLPPVDVRLADELLVLLHESPSEVRVRLPEQGGEGRLTMMSRDDGLSGTVESSYRVRESGLLDELPSHSTNHEWMTTYLLGRISHLVYTDGIGSLSQHRSDFREWMLDWGMWGVEFVEDAEEHIMAAVVWGRDLVLVVFRGTERHEAAHCAIERMAFGLCVGPSKNWVANAQFLPVSPEWGPDVRVHGGFGNALDLVYSELRDRVEEVLTPGRRLYATGHSLGGALATLFAYRAAVVDGLPVHGVYTFGAPRVGNVPFAVRYDEFLGTRTHRWQNRSDFGPTVPPGEPIQSSPSGPPGGTVTFRHVGRLHYLPRVGAAQLHRSSEPFQLATTFSQLTTSDHNMAGHPDSYLHRLFPNLPSTVRSRVPPPP